MQIFFTALVAVAVLLLQAIPGYAFVKCKLVDERAPKVLSRVLLFFCQPCLSLYTFSSARFSRQMLGNIGVFALLTLLIILIMLGGGILVFRKGFKDGANRILTLAMAFSNSAFFGIPIVEAIMGEGAEKLIILTTIFATVMNILAWAVGIAIITGDVKKISAKRIFVNPAIIGVVIATPLFVFSINGETIPALSPFFDAIAVAGRMTTPLSMLIMGMRLATIKFKEIFTSVKSYFAVFVKGIIMPLIALVLLMPMPIAQEVKCVFYIICACPTASVVLNFSELCGFGEREAASSVLISTILAIFTLPLMMLLLPLL